MNFAFAIERVLGHEGGYVNNPDDPGGETNWGISKRSYPELDIKNLTRDQAIAIYNIDFWMKARCSSLPDSVAYQALDFAVNSGPVPAIMALQRAAGAIPDGFVGPVTMARIVAMSPHDLVCRYLAERLEYMTNAKNWPNAGRSWARRIAKNLRYSAEDS